MPLLVACRCLSRLMRHYSLARCHHHHHHVVPLARISLTLSRHFSLLFISSGRSLGLHSLFSQSCCMYVLTGRPAFARPCVGVHRNTSLMSSSLLLQQCNYCYRTQIFLFSVNHLFIDRKNDYKYCYLTLVIRFNPIHYFAHSKMVPSNAM